MKTEITRASASLLMVEQYCAEEQMMHTVMLTQEDLFDMCAMMWPEAQRRWLDICIAEGKRWPPVEKNPQEAPEGPKGELRLVA